MVISSMKRCFCLASNTFAILRAIHLIEYYLVFELFNNRSFKPDTIQNNVACDLLKHRNVCF